MNNFYNQEQGREALTILNEAAQITLFYSVNVWEKQVDLVRQNASRVSSALAFQQWDSPEAVLDFQRQSGAEMLSEWQKFGEDCYALTDSAGKNLSDVAQKGRDFAERTMDDVADQMKDHVPGGKEAIFPDVARQSAKTMSDLCQNSMDAAAQAMRVSMETALAARQTAVNGANGATAAKATNGAAKRKKR